MLPDMPYGENVILLDLDGVLIDNIEFDESIMKGMVTALSRASGATEVDSRTRIHSILEARAGSREYHNWQRLSEGLGLGNTWWCLHKRWRPLLQPVCGSVRLVEHLATSGYSVYVASDAIRPVVDFKLEVLGIVGMIKAAYSQTETGLVKSSPEYFVRLCSDISVRPEQCVFVDNRPMNLIASTQLGIRTVWFRNEEHLSRADEIHHPCHCDAVVDDHAQLADAVLELIRNA